MTKRSMI